MPPPAAVAAPLPPPARRYSREEIVRLGSAAPPRAWEFVGVGVQAVRAAPQDWGMRVLLAANFARLGLKTLAEEQLAALPEEVGRDETVRGLSRAVAGMKEDRIGIGGLEASVAMNLAAVKGARLDGAVERWKGQAREWDWFRATDGNVVRRRGSEFRGLGDARGAAAAFGREHLGTRKDELNVFTVEGTDPPWMVMEVGRRMGRGKDGYWPRLVVVQADELEFLDGLAQADLTEVLGQERTVVCVGAEGLKGELRSRVAGRLSGAYVPVSGLRTKMEPSVPAVIAEVEDEQVAEHERLVTEVAGMYAGRDRAWWRKRFEDVRTGRMPALRVLVPSCRYTTFVKHAGADLVAAFRATGCEAELLIEEDDAFRFATVSYLRAIERFRPDVIVMVNYMRQHIGDWIPGGLPVVCWIQDAMPHQFDAGIGARQGEFDYLVGHVWDELSTRFGFPRCNSLQFPVVASSAKFHAGPIEAGLKHRFECEVALVSHHSETPAAMHERLLSEAGRGAAVQRVLEELRPLVWELATDPMKGPVHARLEAASREAIRKHLGTDAGPKVLAMVHLNYCRPLADRILRHQTLDWATGVCGRRGWRLHIYGRGWEMHPRLAAFARGELGHGEELRAAYACASVHLHASINTLAHQRVMECALSGGLPLCRLIFEGLRPLHVAAQLAAATREAPTVCDPTGLGQGHFVADHPEAAAYTALLQRLGRPTDGFFWVEEKYRAAAARGVKPSPPVDPSMWLIGDAGETAFESAERLEELVERAVRRPSWRAGWSGLIASRVRERFTHQRLAEGLLGLLRASVQEPRP